MHDLYYKGRIHTRLNHVKGGYNTNRDIRLGTVARPLTLTVKDENRKTAITLLMSEHQLVANIIIDAAVDENIVELTTIINKSSPTTLEKTPGRNDPCSCDSGKKYKKCCG
ncbi:MAG: SEC-C domain-containing protein [Oceanospirillaceae bacterium]|nr:SEC-C domain-containing protein [Oceanospirillaceae bacterium]